ncbi:HERV-H LTR-associating protein 2 [Dendropsophus ebraccatus]|uniref:HERV-H LTR-associating protein 2 n=1 Tax=Dendropsophus ebraccatus TaxID=150705 RepID=UPI003831F9CD
MSAMFFLILTFSGLTFIHGAIWGEQNKDVVLPCSFIPEGEEVIHWTTKDGKIVHSYYKSAEQLQKQDKDYIGRTSLILNEIRNGNASLQIRGLKKSDENTYKCYVSTKGERTTENEMALRVVDSVLGEQNKDVILPCSFRPEGEEVIHWTTKDSKNVHSYYKSAEQLQKQDKDYIGRTLLMLNEIRNGNASLQIRGLKKSDENTYKCYVSTKGERTTENEMDLRVIDLQHTIGYEWGDDGVPILTCSVNAAYSKEITIQWYVNEKKLREDHSSKSSYAVQNVSYTSPYQCIVVHSIIQSSWIGNWAMKEPIMKKNSSVTCGCSFCKRTNTNFHIKWNLRKETKEVTIASMNNSLLNISSDYQNRIKSFDDRSLNLNYLSPSDNGVYICLIETEQTMIEMTRVNIRVDKEPRRRAVPICLSIILVVLFGSIAMCKCKKKSDSNE